jgi:hypothetical protein
MLCSVHTVSMLILAFATLPNPWRPCGGSVHYRPVVQPGTHRPCSIRNSALLPLSLKSEAQISSGSRSKQVCPKISLLPIYPTPNSPIPQPAIDSVRRNKTQSGSIKLRAFFSRSAPNPHSAFRSPARSASRNMPKTVFLRCFKPIQGDFNPLPPIEPATRNRLSQAQ